MQTSPRVPATTPRHIKKTGAYFGTLISIPALFFVFSILLLAVGLPILLQERRLRDLGLDASAQITNLFTKPGRGRLVYSVSYTYRGVSTQEAVDEHVFSRLKVGDTIPILYVSSGPRRSEINIDGMARAGVNFSRVATACKLIAAFLVIPPALWLAYFVHLGKTEEKLLRWGNVAPATITGETEYKIKGGRFSRLSYEFPLPPQGLFTGTRTCAGVRKGVPIKEASSTGDIALRTALTVDPIVLYDPKNPNRNALYPFTYVKL